MPGYRHFCSLQVYSAWGSEASRDETPDSGNRAGNYHVILGTQKKITENQKSKPAVLFIHGFALDGITTWQFQVLSLAKDYTVYVPDLLFFGGSTTDKLDRSPE
ncbi:hypothetical protein EV1_034158 [Malus domestica]